MTSEGIHHTRRAGQAGPSLVVAGSLDPVDVTSVTKGHGHIGEDGRVIQDSGERIIDRRRPTGSRTCLDMRLWPLGAGPPSLPY